MTASTTFSAGTVVTSTWLNQVDANIFDFVSNVKNHGAVGDGVTDDIAAFNLAWAEVKSRGGILFIPPGNYLLSAQWVLDVDQTLPHNYLISGYGATLFATAAVTDFAVLVYSSYNNFGIQIEGLQFNHRNNTTVAGCIQTKQANHTRIVKCSMEAHNTKAGYAGIEIGPMVAGTPDTNSFWTIIDGFTTRQRSGSDGTDAAIGIRLKGTANATKIMNCAFTSVVDAIKFDTDGVSAGNANGVSVLHNDFEGVTNCITINTAAPATHVVFGLRVAFNRVEAATTFINFTGAAALDPSFPPNISNNYLTNGSVTNYLVNPNNQIVFSAENNYFGLARNFVGGNVDYQIIADGAGKNLKIANASGTSSYSGAHLDLGGYHMWIDNATSMPFVKANALVPSSSQDGQMCGVVTGTATFAAATTVVVTPGVTMANANYKVMLGPKTNRTFWVTGKTTTQFTINAAAANSDAVDWMFAP